MASYVKKTFPGLSATAVESQKFFAVMFVICSGIIED
jgi:hypothetical protein